MIEWNAPPVRFDRAGTPGFYLTWMRPSVFVGGLMTNLDERSVGRRAADVGAQLDFRFTVLSTLDVTLSAGAAAIATNDRSGISREAIVSLSILR
jgi:hypothetical protein